MDISPESVPNTEDDTPDCIDPSLTIKSLPTFSYTVSPPPDDPDDHNIWGEDTYNGIPSPPLTLARAHTQPPEHHPSPRLPHRTPISTLSRLGHSSPQSGSPTWHQRKNRPPTSAPHLSSEEQWQFMLFQDQTTMTMGVLNHLERLMEQCMQMKTFVRTGFGPAGESAKWARQMEAVRLQLRNWNGNNVTELDEGLKALPVCQESPKGVEHQLTTPPEAPMNGRSIRDLNHSTADSLLDRYDLQFVPTMFLYEKKAIYLRFIGASRSLMHRVLD